MIAEWNGLKESDDFIQENEQLKNLEKKKNINM